MSVSEKNGKISLSPAAADLYTGKARLIKQFLKGSVSDFLLEHTRLMDNYFRERYEKSVVGPFIDISKKPYVVIALGGYGREEQCVHSDVDVLFLFDQAVPDEAEPLMREMIYPLWDAGLDVGHATRSLEETVQGANEDMDILTPLLDARFVCGISSLYTKLVDQLHERILKVRADDIIAWLMERNKKRHDRFGDSTNLLEPNLKDGQGGLRDYHTMLWIARIKLGLKNFQDFKYQGFLLQDEFHRFSNSLKFIWNVRNQLHELTGRKCDQLHFEYQIRLARALKYKGINDHESVEKFLGDLHSKMSFVKQQYLMFLSETGYLRQGRGRKKIVTCKIEGLNVNRGQLEFSTAEKILEDPLLLMQIFEESTRLKIPLSVSAKRLVREFKFLVNDRYRKGKDVIKSFEKILITPDNTGFNVLTEMLNTGFLVQFIPELSSIINKIQYDEYHIFPVDKHVLRTVQTIKSFGELDTVSSDSLPVKLYKKMSGKKLLLWAALLHDIGKGKSSSGHAEVGAEITRNLLERMEFKPKQIETVSFLVEKHLLLIKTATRRDLNDEETTLVCARKIQNTNRLTMLYLLTVADSIATGPKAWNEWTASLLKNLYYKVMDILEKGELASYEVVESIERKKTGVLDSAKTEEQRNDLEKNFKFMSPRYLLYAETDDILRHLSLFKSLGDDDFAWDIAGEPDDNTRTVTVCAKDRPGLFSRIAGVFTLNSIDILDVQVFTWRNKVALDIFKVMPPPDRIFENERWARVRNHLVDSLAGKKDLKKALEKKMKSYKPVQNRVKRRPHRVDVDNKSSSFFTIIDVFTYDFPGLLFAITDALFRSALDVSVAKIATKVDQVVDVFYVRDLNGEKVDTPEQVEAIKSAILNVLPEI
ncbi:MAG: [protein-PII] uridylyltransferase [Desulfobacterales bacterium]|nr:[protein-PII] uridylyltransferase [Desulfobacterales bacterium]